ncbi:MAG TPA: hypothetical protein VJM08_01550, partial [Anaerolineales bacterium]|nr:hypothetical protein [Anaerolineales bacterium]
TAYNLVMNKIPSLIVSLQGYASRFRMWFAAILLHHEYKTNNALQEFNVLDSDDFIKTVFDSQS